MKEWRKLPRYKRLEVSNTGEVRTIWPHKVKEMNSDPGKDGYIWITTTDSETGKQRKIGVHRLVSEAFIPIPEEKKNLPDLEPNHKNGVKTDNRVDNLEWVTRSENLKHAFETGLKKSSSNQNSNSLAAIDKSKGVKAINLKTGETFLAKSAKSMSDITGVSPSGVRQAAFGKKNNGRVKDFLMEEVQ